MRAKAELLGWLALMSKPGGIRKLRKARKMTQEALAREAAVSLGYIARLETGSYDPKLSSLKKLARTPKMKGARLLE